MAKRLYLFRHGPTTAASGNLVGSTDPPLSGQGLARLATLTGHLRHEDLWYCSPMLRARQTVDALRLYGCGIGEIQYDERLREIDFGRWEMKTFQEIIASDPDLISAWSRYMGFVFPDGEAVNDFIHRVQEMLESFSSVGSDRIVVITHGGVIRTLICLALGISVRNYLLFDVQPASLTVLELFEEGGVLKALNV